MNREEIIEILIDEKFIEKTSQNNFFSLLNEKINYQNISWHGILNLSNYCCFDCDYCAQRNSNDKIERFRLDSDSAIETARLALSQGMKSIIVESSVDESVTREMLAYIIYTLKKNHDIELSLNLEIFDLEALKTWRYSGADVFIVRNKKSFDKDYFSSQVYEITDNIIERIRSQNYKLGISNIIGAPFQSIENISDDILLASKYKPDYVYLIPYPEQNSILQKFSPEKKFELLYKSFVILKRINKNLKIIFDDGIFKFQKNLFLNLLKLGCDGIMSNITPDPYRKILSNYRDLFYVEDLMEKIKQEQK